MILSEFDIEHVNRKAIKGHAIVDQLENAPIEISNPILADFPNMHILQIELVT